MILLLAMRSALAGDVVVWHAYHGAEEKALIDAGHRYEEETGQRVAPVAVPWGGFDSKVETAVPRGNGPDLIITAHANIGKWSAMGVIEPFPGPIEGQRPITIEALTRDGALWGAPLAFKSPLLLYDPSQIAVPPRTTDELLAMAKAHTGDGRYGLAYEAATPYYFEQWLSGNGGAVLGPDGAATLDTAPQIAALTYIQRLADVLPVRPTAERVGQLYEDGNAAMVISGPWFAADRVRPIAATSLPIVSETGLPARPYLTVEAAMLCAQADDRDAAIAFARWLAGPEGAAIRKAEGWQAVSSTAVSLDDDPLLSALATQADAAVPLPTDPDVQSAFEAEGRALRRVLRGSTSPTAAAAEAQSYWRSLVQPKPVAVDPASYVVAVFLGALAAGALVIRAFSDGTLWRKIARHRWDYLWVLPATATVTALVVVPFLVGAGMSLFATWHGTWTFVGFDNFASILGSRDWPISSPMSFFYTLTVTVLWTVANLTLHVGLGVTLALALREPWIRMRPAFRALLVLPWAVPNYITALIWRTMFDAQYGAVNTALGALSGHGGPAQIDWFGSFSAAFCANFATNTWLGFPFMMVVTLGALQAIPRDLEEAAEIDGAGYFARLRHVIWPLLKPALLPAVVMGSVWTFNMFNVIYLVSGGEPDGGTEILVSQAYRWAFSRGNMYGYASAYAVIIFGVLLIYSRSTARLLEKSHA